MISKINAKKITSLQHPLIKHLVKLRSNRRYRSEKQTIFVEGKKLLSELHRPFKRLIVREGEITSLTADEIIIIPSHLFEKISGVRSPEGVAVEMAMPSFTDLSTKKYLLALDGVKDPGNLGTLMRTALAFGFEGVFLTHSTVDPYNEKALRASKGATLKLPLQKGQLEPFVKGFHLYVADLKGASLQSVKFKTPAILFLGSEAQGLSKQVQKIGTSITIPIKKEMESLNVAIAGAILMHAMRCQSSMIF